MVVLVAVDLVSVAGPPPQTAHGYVVFLGVFIPTLSLLGNPS